MATMECPTLETLIQFKGDLEFVHGAVDESACKARTFEVMMVDASTKYKFR